MSEIDWDKAPEGATHYTPGCYADGTNAVFWRVIEGSVVNAWAVFKSGDLKEISINRLLDLSRQDLLARPSPAWSGEGLPPVGVVCEVHHDSRWYQTTIIGIDPDDGSRVFKTHADYDTPYDGFVSASSFRPIRTKEQIAADERTHEIRNALTLISHKVEKVNTDIDCSLAIAETVSAMIESGYRKP